MSRVRRMQAGLHEKVEVGMKRDFEDDRENTKVRKHERDKYER